MKMPNRLLTILISVLAIGLVQTVGKAAEPATAAVGMSVESPGTIVGIVTNAAKAPVARATVTAVREGGNGIRATVSSSDGIYSFADLLPGAWSLSVQADGYPDLGVA
jgi:hypothetical protein